MKDQLSLNRIQELSKKVLDKTISEDELIELDQWYTSYNDNEVTELSEQELQDLGRKLYTIIKEKNNPPIKRINFIRIISSCAAVLAMLLIGYWLYFSFNDGNEHAHLENKQAVIRDAKGNEHTFDDLQVGEQRQAGALAYMKEKDGSIVFLENNKEQSNNEISTVITPKGGEYKIHLPDGTMVWMNADSKLEFNVAFSKHERHVKLQGEAYFEVKHLNNTPFIVETPKEKIRVLGTKFNVYAYLSEEKSITSLTEGSVQVGSKDKVEKAVILKPGQQSVRSGNKVNIQNFDVNEVLAWKNGEFMFNQVRLEEVTEALARWYDVEFEFSDAELRAVEIWGTLSKSENLEQNLLALQKTVSAKFEIKGRRVMVIK
ncbi:FecR family protein [Sphingobacterium anhuiense]|uniref:FecR family protein n=1 Tax=Sphingobacterium anhuiense TaxID=493780 RepID=UPI0028EBB482|nr:FecR domain-containing protein [uncultured Sphingobacterium sp.]